MTVTRDITEDLPTPLGGGAGDGRVDPGAWDVLIGDLGFLIAPSADNPYERATETTTKQQIDTSSNAGEQTLSSWWARSQNTWDSGAGVTWYEPGSDENTQGRYRDSRNVDVWTAGQLSLLDAAQDPVDLTADGYVCGLEVGGVAGYVVAHGSVIEWYPATGAADTQALAGGSATQPAAVGGAVWVGYDGGVARYAPGAAPVERWTLTGVARCWWVKSRVVVAVGNVLYAVGADAAAGALTTVGTVLLTHVDAAWVWTDVSESSGAILAAGRSGGDSAIFRFPVENDTSGVPVIQAGEQVGRFPPGEVVECMQVYLGSTIVLGTNRGVRVGQVSNAGDVNYGPLLVATSAVDVTFRDRFAYLAATDPDGHASALRVDLSRPIGDTGLFAYAWDMPTTVTTPTSLALVGDKVVVAADAKTWQQGDTSATSGWLDTGNIRFGTSEPKVFRYVRTDAQTNGGTVQLDAVDPAGNVRRIIAMSDIYATSEDVAISGYAASSHMAVRVTMTPGTVSPVMGALTVKATPTPHKVRRVKYPLSCLETEADRHGRTHRSDPWTRIAALEELESSPRAVTVLDTRTGESFTAQIESVAFSGSLGPSKNAANVGGMLTVTVRML